MDILKERFEATKEHMDEISKGMTHDECKKVGAILDILEIGESSIAHAKMILHTCEETLEKCSIAFGTRRDA